MCGDFGLVWDNGGEDKWWRKWLDSKPFTTPFIDGNHENFDLLYEFPEEEWHGGKVHRISDCILHLMRGQVCDIHGKTFFTMGGAQSHDMEVRQEWINWWRAELPSVQEYEIALKNLDKNNWEVDYVLTHCCGTSNVKEILQNQYNIAVTISLKEKKYCTNQRR